MVTELRKMTLLIHTCQHKPEESYTKQYQKHEPLGFCCYIKCFDDSVYTPKPVTYTKESENDDVLQILVEMLEKDIRDIYQKFKFEKKMIFGNLEKKIYQKSTTCHIC